MMKLFIFCLALLMVSSCSHAAKNIEGNTYISKEEYWGLGKPCACPSDAAKNGRCGKRAALCKAGGKHISNCDSTVVRSLDDYLKVQRKLCH